MRGFGRLRMGYFPLPLSEAERIRKFLVFLAVQSSAVDPCVGDGMAFETITNAAQLLRYGIELDAYRAEQARERISQHDSRECAGSALPSRELRVCLLQPAVRLDAGVHGEQAHGAVVPQPHLPLAEARRRAGARYSRRETG